MEMSAALLWGLHLLSGRQDFRGLWTDSFHGAEGKGSKAKFLALFQLVTL